MKRSLGLLSLRFTHSHTSIGAASNSIANRGEMRQKEAEAAEEEGDVDVSERGVGQSAIRSTRGGGGRHGGVKQPQGALEKKLRKDQR